MKAYQIIVLILTMSPIVLFAQDSNIIFSLDGPAYGVKIKNNFPSATSDFYREFSLSNENALVNFFGMGVFGHVANGVSTSTYGYLGASYNNPSMAFFPNGNVAIGSTSNTGYKLAVAGNMIAESVKVKLQSAWPDYVFTKDYKLPSLQSTEQHIREKGHLHGIPSAADVRTNGVDLGEMNAKLLQKIEELTLHVINLNKKIEIIQQSQNKQTKN